jgi:hypothetical protein
MNYGTFNRLWREQNQTGRRVKESLWAEMCLRAPVWDSEAHKPRFVE